MTTDNLFYRLQVFNEDLSQLKRHADSLLRELGGPLRLQLKINEAEAKLVFQGEADSLDIEKRAGLSALASVKDKILALVTIKEERNLVKIDMQILEINRDDIKKLGFDHADSTVVTDNANKVMNETNRYVRPLQMDPGGFECNHKSLGEHRQAPGSFPS